ncbi:MAG: glycosyltransferase family 2 protein [Myxococcota bacterium]
MRVLRAYRSSERRGQRAHPRAKPGKPYSPKTVEKNTYRQDIDVRGPFLLIARRTSIQQWPSMVPVSAIVLTKNEEANIGSCLDSLSWCDDVHVIDSGSTDATVALAEQRGAFAHLHAFEGFGQQRQWANDNAGLRHNWVLHLDADERCTGELETELKQLMNGSPEHAAYEIASKTFLNNKWIRFSSRFPVYQVRLVNRHETQFVDAGHGQSVSTRGTVGRLRAPYEHYNFSKGLVDWLERHNRYSSKEANDTEDIDWTAFGRSKQHTRQILKALAQRMPGRAGMTFAYVYLLRGGFLDGREGLTYAKLRLIYELMIDVKRSNRDASSESTPV